MTDDTDFDLDVSESRDAYKFTVFDAGSGEKIVDVKVTKDADVDAVKRILEDFAGETQDIIDALDQYL